MDKVSKESIEEIMQRLKRLEEELFTIQKNFYNVQQELLAAKLRKKAHSRKYLSIKKVSQWLKCHSQTVRGFLLSKKNIVMSDEELVNKIEKALQKTKDDLKKDLMEWVIKNESHGNREEIIRTDFLQQIMFKHNISQGLLSNVAVKVSLDLYGSANEVLKQHLKNSNGKEENPKYLKVY